MNPDEELAKLVQWARWITGEENISTSFSEIDAAEAFLKFHDYLSDSRIRRLPMAWFSPE